MSFQGPACDDITDSGDVSLIETDGPFFTGNLVKMSTRRTPSRDFNLVKTEVAGNDILTVKVRDNDRQEGDHVPPPPLLAWPVINQAYINTRWVA